ncbi:amidase family protein [Nocardia macrotermitis]|nr:amidase [Nocardia macrotermitis]
MARDTATLPQALRGPLSERVARTAMDPNELLRYRQAVRQWVPVADERYRCCSYLPLGADIPAVRIGVKDTADIAGWPTRLGLPHHRAYPDTTASVLRGLPVDALFAKLVTTQLSVGRASGCVNPYFPAVDPAGSSTGSAVAVAANICDVALGTDVLGSVRFPAGCCGVVALRMTHHPALLPGLLTVSPVLDAPGWITRTVADLAYVWEQFGLDHTIPTLRSRGGTRTVGVVADVFGEDCDDDVVAAVHNVDALARAGGLGVRSVDLSTIWHSRADAWRMCAYDTERLGQRWSAEVGDELDEATRAAFGLIAPVRSARYAAVQDELHRVRSLVTELFDNHGVDAWLMPLSQRLPVPTGTIAATVPTILNPSDALFARRLGFTSLASAAGLPAVCFPIGVDLKRQTPIPIQLVGPPGSETALIEIAARIAAQVELHLLPR